ncbi:glycosyltransferase [Tellurirhabdus rosea]|uniref:glycosyltransferase n=1 Tax=Tellurirhabdus rosea TaxID=2674997 RepID=UPI00224DB4FB|nr:glycosyltransferase [Tellurirhabdus rosea]
MIEVSILIAARNEEVNIRRCLDSLDRLDYPKDRLEILIGNDRSEDATSAVVQHYLPTRPHLRLFDITERVGSQAGKSNVLAQLARRAQGQFLLFTDADVAVAPTWVSQMLQSFGPSEVGIVTGCTQIIGQSAFERCQAVEWLYAQWILKQFADWGIPVTAMGNNMAVRREAYEKTGGYEHLPFSVVEDYQLLHAVLQQGYTFAHRFDEGVLATTLPMRDGLSWLRQRKRWMVGAFQTQWYFILLFLAQALWYPLLILLSLWNPALALGLFTGKLIGQTLHAAYVLNRIRRRDLWRTLPLYEPFVQVSSLLSLIYFLLPTKVIWKGRDFGSSTAVRG